MESQVKVKSPNIKITVTIGLFLTILVIWLSVWFAIEVRLILLGVGGTVTLLIFTFAGHKAALWRLHRKELSLNTAILAEKLRQARLEADRLELSRHVLNFDHKQRLLVPRDYASSVTVIEPNVQPGVTLPALPEPAAEPLNFLSILPKLQNVLIVGGPDSGKTTLLRTVAYHRQGIKVAIDPHLIDPWPLKTTIIGSGRDYNSIERALQDLVTAMDSRYKLKITGPLVTLCIDEWLSIIGKVATAGESIKTLITEARKAGISIFLGSHTNRGRAIGLTGSTDILEGMAIIYLHYNAKSGERSAEITFNGKDREPLIVPPPPPFESSSRIIQIAPGKVQPSAQEQQIIELHAAGESISSIAAAVFGSKGGHQNQQVKNVLKKAGVRV